MVGDQAEAVVVAEAAAGNRRGTLAPERERMGHPAGFRDEHNAISRIVKQIKLINLDLG